ncbi:MAG: hypothetical protein ABL860_04310 [Candidatus Nitrotoga sp.]
MERKRWGKKILRKKQLVLAIGLIWGITLLDSMAAEVRTEQNNPLGTTVLMALTPLQAYAIEINPAGEPPSVKMQRASSSRQSNFDLFLEGIRNVHP